MSKVPKVASGKCQKCQLPNAKCQKCQVPKVPSAKCQKAALYFTMPGIFYVYISVQCMTVSFLHNFLSSFCIIFAIFLHNIYIQGVKVYSGKSLSSIFGRNQCLYWNKWYTRRKPLISALIWHLKSDCSLKNVSYTFHRRQEVKNPFRGHKIQQNMLFAAKGRGILLTVPQPLSGPQTKAEIQGFLLMYRLFLY